MSIRSIGGLVSSWLSHLFLYIIYSLDKNKILRKLKMNLKEKMRVIEGFPKAGISYKDITTILQDSVSLKEMVDALAAAIKDLDFDLIVGTESRGFIVGMPVAYALNKGFVMARKPGKLPGNLLSKSYKLEYGEATIEIDKDTIAPACKVIIMDDLLATGGTAKTTCDLVKEAGGIVVSCLFLTELTDLNGRKILEDAGYPVKSLLTWNI